MRRRSTSTKRSAPDRVPALNSDLETSATALAAARGQVSVGADRIPQTRDELVAAIRRECRGRTRWFAMNADSTAYCIDFDWKSDGERWFERMKADYPEWLKQNGYHLVEQIEQSPAERLATAAADLLDPPVAWIEAEPSAAGLSIKELVNSLVHSTRWHWQEECPPKRGGNVLLPLRQSEMTAHQTEMRHRLSPTPRRRASDIVAPSVEQRAAEVLRLRIILQRIEADPQVSDELRRLARAGNEGGR